MTIPNQTCLHCHESGILAIGRGLCRRCWGNLTIKRRYPPLKNTGYKDRPDPLGLSVVGGGSLPEPIAVIPGTEEKVAVMEQRAQNGQPLFHPDEPEMRPSGGRVTVRTSRDFTRESR